MNDATAQNVDAAAVTRDPDTDILDPRDGTPLSKLLEDMRENTDEFPDEVRQAIETLIRWRVSSDKNQMVLWFGNESTEKADTMKSSLHIQASRGIVMQLASALFKASL